MTRLRGGVLFEKGPAGSIAETPHPPRGCRHWLRGSDGWEIRAELEAFTVRLRSRLPGGNVNPRRSAIVGELVDVVYASAANSGKARSGERRNAQSGALGVRENRRIRHQVFGRSRRRRENHLFWCVHHVNNLVLWIHTLIAMRARLQPERSGIFVTHFGGPKERRVEEFSVPLDTAVLKRHEMKVVAAFAFWIDRADDVNHVAEPFCRRRHEDYSIYRPGIPAAQFPVGTDLPQNA